MIKSMYTTATDVIQLMLASGSQEKAIGMQRFFKCGQGQYGEGDVFIGLSNPEMRKFVKVYKTLPLSEIILLVQSPYHEVRTCGLLIMVKQYEKGNEAEQELLYKIYLENTAHINNWDLVDLTAPYIVGKHLLNRDRTLLYKLAKSSLLWDQRIAILATFTFIRNNDFNDTLKLATFFLTHKHDLIHKAVGWMLREIGKRDQAALSAFLLKYRLIMPRTTLRYAIEHFQPEERKKFLKRDLLI